MRHPIDGRERLTRSFLMVGALAVSSVSSASGQARWAITEDLRIGNEEGEAYSFTDVRGIAVGTNGQIFVLDFRTHEARDADYGLIPKVKPVIEALDVDDAGMLWVRLTSTDSTATVFEVFDANGRNVAAVRAPFRISPYWHPGFRGDRMYTVVLDEDDVPVIVRARIRR